MYACMKGLQDLGLSLDEKTQSAADELEDQLIQNEILGTGIPAADLAGQVCFALLALKAVLCMGRVTRS